MLLRWSQSARAAIKIQKPIKKGKSGSLFETNEAAAIGRVATATIEANDVYRAMRKTTTQTAPNEIQTSGEKTARRTPAKDAMPLPPLKPSKAGQQCPPTHII